MKRLLLFLFLLFSMGCVSNEYEIVASIKPLYLIAKEFGNATYLVPEGSNPHFWEPSPSALRVLKEAKVYVRVGNGFEEWDRDMPKPKWIINASDYLPSDNPHVWLNPEVARRIAKELAKITGKEDRFFKFEECLNSTISRIKREAKARNISYVAYHPAFTHFAEYFGLHERAFLTIHGEVSLKRYEDVKEIMRKEGIRFIFISDHINPELANKLARETNSTVVRIDIFGRNADNYCDYLWNVWDRIRKATGG